MDQHSRRSLLIRMLLDERGLSDPVPDGDETQRRLLRASLNTRPAIPADEELLRLQDSYLSEDLHSRGIVNIDDLAHFGNRMILWKGDITRLKVDAIVNAANGRLTGCWVPGHNCVDNCIHTYAGMQLRIECARLMKEQHRSEPVGNSIVTPAYNLPCKNVIHTVGPNVRGEVTETDRENLRSCYAACLKEAESRRLRSLAFCCISAGTFGFPVEEASEIAVDTVSEFLGNHDYPSVVIFDVFLDCEESAYLRTLADRGFRRTG